MPTPFVAVYSRDPLFQFFQVLVELDPIWDVETAIEYLSITLQVMLQAMGQPRTGAQSHSHTFRHTRCTSNFRTLT